MFCDCGIVVINWPNIGNEKVDFTRLLLFWQKKKLMNFENSYMKIYLKAEQFISLSKKTVLPHPVVIIPIL